jgi:hypothetical protein
VSSAIEWMTEGKVREILTEQRLMREAIEARLSAIENRLTEIEKFLYLPPELVEALKKSAKDGTGE